MLVRHRRSALLSPRLPRVIERPTHVDGGIIRSLAGAPGIHGSRFETW